MKRFFWPAGLAIVLIAAAGYFIWWNSPRQKAIRFLSKLSEVASVLEFDSALARRRRVPKLLKLLEDPVSLEVRAISMKRRVAHGQVSTGYLGVVLNSKQLLVNFTDIEVIRTSSTNIVATARLATDCDYRESRYSMQAPVEVDIVLGEDGPRLGGVVEISQ